MRKKKDRVDRRRVKAWMVMERLRVKDIQRALGHKHHSPTVETLTGVRDNRQVLGWLRDHGCPVTYLKLPEDMLEDN